MSLINNLEKMTTQVMKFRNSRKSVILTVFLGGSLLLASCSSEKKNLQTAEDYQVAMPIVADTSVTKDYVAEIQAVQNVLRYGGDAYSFRF